MRIIIALGAVLLLSAWTNMRDDLAAAQKKCQDSFAGNLTAITFCLGSSERQIITAYEPQSLPSYAKFSARRFELAGLWDKKQISSDQYVSGVTNALNIFQQNRQVAAAPQVGTSEEPTQSQVQPNNSARNLATMLMMGTAFLNGYNNAEAASRARGPVMTTCNRVGGMVNCLSD